MRTLNNSEMALINGGEKNIGWFEVSGGIIGAVACMHTVWQMDNVSPIFAGIAGLTGLGAGGVIGRLINKAIEAI